MQSKKQNYKMRFKSCLQRVKLLIGIHRTIIYISLYLIFKIVKWVCNDVFLCNDVKFKLPRKREAIWGGKNMKCCVKHDVFQDCKNNQVKKSTLTCRSKSGETVIMHLCVMWCKCKLWWRCDRLCFERKPRKLAYKIYFNLSCKIHIM